MVPITFHNMPVRLRAVSIIPCKSDLAGVLLFDAISQVKFRTGITLASIIRKSDFDIAGGSLWI